MASALDPALRTRLEEADWYDRMGTLSCFGTTWTVRTDDPELAALLRELFDSVRSPRTDDPPMACFSVLTPSPDGPGVVIRDTAWVAYEGSSAGAVLSGLVWCINRLVIEEVSGHLLLHTTAAAVDGEALLMVGRPNSGKTTLLTGLLERGYDYMTDEVVSLDDDLNVTGFPKPLTIDRGAWQLLGHLDPRCGATRDRFHAQQWHVATPRLAKVAPRGRIAAVVFPRYSAGATTSIRALRPAQVVANLVPNVFAPEQAVLPLDRVMHIVALAAAVPTYAMDYGDRDAAIEKLSALAPECRPHRHPAPTERG